jgi:nucleotide-binding universal stress UspA family protein
MFARILCANDGSERAFRALGLAITIAKAAGSELHMVSVEEIDYMPEFIEEIREETATAARRFHKAHQRARALAEEHQVGLRIHLLTGHAVRDIVSLAGDLKADLLVIHRPFAFLRADAGQPGRSAGSPRALPGSGGEIS